MINKRIRILLLSDIHSDFDKLKSVLNTLKPNSYDKVLVPGDNANLPLKDCVDENKKQESIDELILMLETIRITLGLSHKDIYFLPGNHDHKVFFEGIAVTEFTNMHLKRVELDEGLFMVGIGGSVPGRFSATGKHAFDGFPYESQEAIENDIEKVKALIGEEEKQFILFTHSGPSKSGTSVINEPGEEEMLTGVDGFDSFLHNYQENMIFQVHGHSHYANGCYNHLYIKVLNPGSISFTNTYGELILENEANKWILRTFSINKF